MQSAIQPGCTQLSSCKRRFLAYNMLGSISSCESDGFSHVEVDFHDTSRGLRVPSMTDYFGFTMAAMNDKGSIFANPQKGEKNPSTLLYRPFNSWTNNSEWSMRFPVEEEVKAVAIGNGWAAAATSLHFLRVYSEAGLQTFVLSLSGPVVALAGHEHQLAVVIHASNPLASGDQILEFLALDMRKKRQTQAGRLPLSPGATLTWLGFSEAGCLSTYDSEAWLLDPLPLTNHTQMGVLRVYSSEFNGCWVPLFRASEERKGTDVNFWMVGLNSTQVFCVVCKAPSVEPQVLPKPVLGIFSTSVPVIHSDLGADDLENAYLRGILQLTQAHTKAVEAAVAGCDDEDEEESLLKKEVEVDRCLLRLIAAACKGATLQSDRKKISLKLLLSVGWPLHCSSLRASFDPKHVHMIPNEELQLGVKRSTLFVEAFFLFSAQVLIPHA
ncbi:unnamed protein product [Sphagnum jensenii]|uniref:WDHD1/CFT4 second beta-propeller domain-containing protein n=1 Tax=Sphagnum jensenii TaxID=128206 RepID=A0ABP1A3C1_9BRYO